MKAAIIGHSGLNIAPAVAADLALRGIDVAWWPAPEAVRAQGAIRVQGGAARLDAGVDGPARVVAAPSAAAALDGAQACITDIPPEALFDRVMAFAPALPSGIVLHVQSHGYWPALRLARALRRDDVVLTDSSAPTHAAGFADGVLVPHWRRRGLRFSAVNGDPMPVLRLLYPDALPASSPLETGLEGINLMVHPAISLLNIAAFERAAAAGEAFSFYGAGNTPAAGQLAAALDAERGRVCQALSVRHRTLPQALADMYGAVGDTPHEAVARCPYYQALGPLPADSWRRWASQDLPFAIMPLLRLADRGGIAVNLHRGIAAVFQTLLGDAVARLAPTLADLGLDIPEFHEGRV